MRDKLKIGQREVPAWVFLIVMVVSVLIGDTPEQVLPVILEVLTPFALVIATLINYINVIQTRVESNDLKAGDLLALLRMRETVYALIILIVGALSAGGRNLLGIEFSNDSQQLIVDFLVNGGMIAGNILLASFTTRASRQPALPEAKTAQVAEAAHT